MKTRVCSALFAALLLPAALVAGSFEGKIGFKVTSDGKSQDIVYNLKGDKMRLEMPGMKGGGGMILDLGKRESTMIMDDQRMYMTMAMPDASAAPNQGKQEETKLEKTGETEKILGHTATKYIATQQNSKTELWLAEGLGTFMSFNNSNPMGGGGGRRGGGQAAQAWERALAGKDLFPLRVVGKDKSGKENFRMEATQIDKASLPDSMFAPPAGYQKFDMGGMMKGMIPGIGR